MKKELDNLFSDKPKKDKESKDSFLADLKDIENDNSAYSFLPSSLIDTNEEKPKKEKKKKKEKKDKNPDDWLFELEELCAKPSKKHIKKAGNDIFEMTGMKKKKKNKNKNKEGGDLINYKKEFEPEMALFKNLLVEQNKFTRSLQQNYDNLTQTTSSNRGVTKQMTDLIENINSARNLSMQLVEKNVNAKKIIAELNMKQRKEFGTGLSDGDNISDYAANYLKQLMTNRSEFAGNVDNVYIEDYT